MKQDGYKPGPTRSRVLKLRRKGLSGVEIAKVLGVTHQTVYTHLKALRQRGVLPSEDR